MGAGALLDATSRGLRAALVEQTDIAAGTSSRSSRLIHGGLRYLEQLHVGLVAEALDERARLLRLAPHLVRLEPFLFPIYGWPLIHQGFYGSGILLYDLLGSRHGAGFARHMRPDAAVEFAPQLRRRGAAGRDPVPRRGRGRRPVHARGPPHGARYGPRRGRGDARPRRGAAPRGRPRDRGPRPRPRHGLGVRDSGDPRRRRDRRLGGPSRGALRARGRRRPDRPEPGRPHRHPARAAPGPRRDDPPDPRPGRLHRPVAGPLDHRHHRPRG